MTATEIQEQLALGLKIYEKTKDPMLLSAIQLLTPALADPEAMTTEMKRAFDLVTRLEDAYLTLYGESVTRRR